MQCKPNYNPKTFKWECKTCNKGMEITEKRECKGGVDFLKGMFGI